MSSRTSEDERRLRDLILDRVDVIDVASALRLTYEYRRGSLFLPCFVHADRDPSLHVDVSGEKKGQWHCFGCRAGGGLASLVARVLKMEHPRVVGELDLDAAWAWLARRAGVTGDEPARPGRASLGHEPKLPPPLRLPEGTVPAWTHADALEYLAIRGVSERQARLHQLGYWPRKRRVIVPSVVGGVLRTWDARAIDPGVQPKTFGAPLRDGAQPDSAVFGYDLLPRGAARIVLAEGPWGALHATRLTGLPAAALRGSVLHEQQARLVARLAPVEVVVLGDGDTAGRKLVAGLAALAALVPVRARTCPEGTQPDDLSARDLRVLIAGAPPFTPAGVVDLEVSCQPK